MRSTEKFLELQTKKLFFPLSNISNHLGIWRPKDFIALRLNALWLKIKT